jgi:phosphatidylserine/phosphatidylglycerophosphate/cardiolipin synthase-like enzyme
LKCAYYSGVEVVVILDDVGSLYTRDAHVAGVIAAGGSVVRFNPVLVSVTSAVRIGVATGWWWIRRAIGSALPFVSAGAPSPLAGNRWTPRLFNPFFRTHRKLLICDDVAFVGGMNVAKEYAGVDSDGSRAFRDAHLKVEGPAVHDLAQVFKSSLRETASFTPLNTPRRLAQATGSPDGDNVDHVRRVSDTTDTGTARAASVEPSRVPVLSRQQAGASGTGGAAAGAVPTSTTTTDSHSNAFVIVLESNSRRSVYQIQRSLRLALAHASTQCLFTTPHFVPPRGLTRAMCAAAARGVDVRIMTSYQSDVALFTRAGRHVQQGFVAAGVRIFEYTPGGAGPASRAPILHAKTACVDGFYASVGSFNLDVYSSAMNMEVNVTVVDRGVARALENRFMHDLTDCVEVTRETINSRSSCERLINWAAYSTVRLLRFVF